MKLHLLFRSPRSLRRHRPFRSISLAAFLSIGLPAWTPLRAADAPTIPLEQTPPEAQKTIKANIGAGSITSISKGDEDGTPSYEVSFTKGGQARDLAVGEDGRLLKIQMALAETPPAVQKSIQAQLGGDRLDAIEKTFDVDETSYVVEITTKDGRSSQFSVGEDGAIFEVEIALNEAPPAVQKTVTAQIGNGTLTTLTKYIDDKVTYEASFAKAGGGDGGAVVGSEGALLSAQIPLEEAGAAQKTILARVGNGKILSVWKSFEKREKVFPVKVRSLKDGKTFNFSVGPKGRFLGLDD